MSEQSKLGADGLEVVGWHHSHAEVATSDKARVASWLTECVEPLCRLTDAKARLAQKDARISQLAAHARCKNKALANALAEVEMLRGELEHAEQWRELALQFDRHRMNAMALIKAVAHGFAGAPECKAFAAVPPIPGHAITAEIAELRAQLQPAPAERGVVLPALKVVEQAWGYDEGGNYAEGFAEGYNDAIDDVQRLNPAPATADSDVPGGAE